MKLNGEKVERSSFYRSAIRRAQRFAREPGLLNQLLDKALRKARARQKQLREVWDSLQACVRLLRAYAGGSYRDIPWASLISIIAAVIYFVNPADLIPDILFHFGLIDDAALLGWVLTAVKSDIEAFLEWERRQSAPPDEEEESTPERADAGHS